MATLDEDQPTKYDEEIRSAHPSVTGDHETYALALELVGAKKSKYAIVDLVNWLLSSCYTRHEIERAVDSMMDQVEKVPLHSNMQAASLASSTFLEALHRRPRIRCPKKL